jgi:hypothetical protein
MDKKLSPKITKILYDRSGFIADNFHDEEMRDLYRELNDNTKEYEELFSNFSCVLVYEHKCYYLTRSNITRQFLESRLKDYYEWADIIIFMHDVLNGKPQDSDIKPGLPFRYSELLTVISNSATLSRRISALSIFLKQKVVFNGTEDYVKELVKYLEERQIIDSFVFENTRIYQLTSVFEYYTKYVLSITLRIKEEKDHEGTEQH